MDTELKAKLEAQEQKLDAIFKSTEKTRKYFLVLMWVSIIVIVLPSLGLIFAVPLFINSYVGSFDGLL